MTSQKKVYVKSMKPDALRYLHKEQRVENDGRNHEAVIEFLFLAPAYYE